MLRRFALLGGAAVVGIYAAFALLTVLQSVAHPADAAETVPGILLVLGVCAGYIAIVLGREAFQDPTRALRPRLRFTVLRGFGIGWIAGVVVAGLLALIRSSTVSGFAGGGLGGMVADLIGLLLAPLIFAIPGLAALTVSRRWATTDHAGEVDGNSGIS